MSPRDRELEDKTAIVTGGSRGIGLAIAEALAARGARVALFARDEAALARAAERLGDAALPVRTDVRDPDSVRAAFELALRKLGRLDVLVNNAAVGILHRVERAADAELRAQVETNLLGAIYCARAAIAALREAGGGDIVNVSSDSVREPWAYLGVYAATKGALEVFTRALRRELAPDRIRVTLVRSGPTLTDFASSWDPDLAAEAARVWNAEGTLRKDSVMAPSRVGEAVAFAVTRPAGVGVETLEIRAAAT